MARSGAQGRNNPTQGRNNLAHSVAQGRNNATILYNGALTNAQGRNNPDGKFSNGVIRYDKH